MRTNIDIDDKLMKKAIKASKLERKTKKAVVEEALQLLVQMAAQGEIRKLFGKVKFVKGYDPKELVKDKWAEAERRWQEDQKAAARSSRKQAA